MKYLKKIFSNFLLLSTCCLLIIVYFPTTAQQKTYCNPLDISYRYNFEQLNEKTLDELKGIKGIGEKSFLKQIRHEACGDFNTVLGPGQPYHKDHFHLDMANRRSKYCT